MLLVVACMPFVVSVFSLAIAIPALERSKRAAEGISAVASLRALEQAEIMYETTYPDRGFACQLSQLGGNAQAGAPTPDAAQLIQDDLASGKKSGYTFAISKCTGAAAGKGSQPATEFQVTAVPDDPSHSRGFCEDQSGEIMADPKGGTDCAVPVE